MSAVSYVWLRDAREEQQRREYVIGIPCRLWSDPTPYGRIWVLSN